MDIYTLITSGYIGITIYVALIILFLISYWKLKKQNNSMGILAIATFSMYLFSALFETTLFNGGVLLNYLLLPVFLILLDYRSETEDETLEDLNEVKK